MATHRPLPSAVAGGVTSTLCRALWPRASVGMKKTGKPGKPPCARAKAPGVTPARPPMGSPCTSQKGGGAARRRAASPREPGCPRGPKAAPAVPGSPGTGSIPGGAMVGSTGGGTRLEEPSSPSRSSVPAPVGSGPAALVSAAPEELMTELRSTGGRHDASPPPGIMITSPGSAAGGPGWWLRRPPPALV